MTLGGDRLLNEVYNNARLQKARMLKNRLRNSRNTRRYAKPGSSSGFIKKFPVYCTK